MSDPKGTLAAMDKVLQDAKAQCAWDSMTFASSQFVYLGRSHITEFKALLERLGAEVDSLTQQLVEERKVTAQLDSAREEIEHLDADNNALRRHAKEVITVVQSKDIWIEKQKDALAKLRKVFKAPLASEKHPTPEELLELLKYVDAVLAQ